jgi:ribonuclease-3
VLGLAAARHLAAEHPEAREGELTRMRAALVGEPSLAAAARDLELGGRLLFGRGEERSGGREKPSILAGALEALVGAVFSTAGAALTGSAARSSAAVGTRSPRRVGDAKTRSRNPSGTAPRPEHTLVRQSGPAHRPLFVAEALLAARLAGEV